jgi:AraC family transcriptional regulator
MNQAGHDQKVAEDVIDFMTERLSEAVRIDDLARTANYSKFHFCRLFRKATGITPSRFLSALRLKEARRLLLTTDLTVCDVSCEVGYNSVGTFTSRFTRGVGLPPSVFRSSGGYRAEGWADRDGLAGGIGGELITPPGHESDRVIVGAFPTPIPEGQPERCVVVQRSGRWRLPALPAGLWYIAAAAVAADQAEELDSPLLEEDIRLYGSLGPVRIRPDGDRRPDHLGRAGRTGRPDQAGGNLRLRLRPPRRTDPPMLFAPPRRPVHSLPVQSLPAQSLPAQSLPAPSVPTQSLPAPGLRPAPATG